jgi:probable HAF family extracellular repeat protein
MTGLDPIAETYSEAFGINNIGQIVGGAETASGEFLRFLYSKGIVTFLETLGGTYSVVNAISDAGQMVGVSTTPEEEYHAFLYTRPRVPPRRP